MNSRLKRIQLVRTVERRVDIVKVGVKFYSYLKGRFEDGEREFELNNGSNIRDLLNLLCTSPEQRQAIFDQSGELSQNWETVGWVNQKGLEYAGLHFRLVSSAQGAQLSLDRDIGEIE